MMANYKQDALDEIAALAQSHGLSLQDIAGRLSLSAPTPQKNSKLAAKILAYIGGLLVVGGLTVLIRMEWDGMSSLGHVLVTLIPGFLLFAVGLYCSRETQFDEVATSLILLAAMIEPTGVMIVLKDYANMQSGSHMVLVTCLVLLAQNGMVFSTHRAKVLAFTMITFGLIALGTLLHIFEVIDRDIGMILGAPTLGIAYWISKTQQRWLSPLSYIVGSIMFLAGFANWVYDRPVELLFLGMTALFIYASILLKSRALLATSATATLTFIGYYSDRYFAHTIGWPITLILAGGLMIVLGFGVVKLNEKYISPAYVAR